MAHTSYETVDAISIGHCTLVGVMNEQFPLKHGNCFSLVTANNNYSIINFVYENLKELISTGVINFPISIHILGKGVAAIHDPRIPDNWYKTDVCEICIPHEFVPLNQKMAKDRRVLQGKLKITKYSDGSTVEREDVKCENRSLKDKWTILEEPTLMGYKGVCSQPEDEPGKTEWRKIYGEDGTPGFIYAPYIPDDKGPKNDN